MSETKTKPKVSLVGKDGNAMFIIGACARALRKAGQHEEAETFQKEAMSGDYDGVLQAAMKYCDVE